VSVYLNKHPDRAHDILSNLGAEVRQRLEGHVVEQLALPPIKGLAIMMELWLSHSQYQTLRRLVSPDLLPSLDAVLAERQRLVCGCQFQRIELAAEDLVEVEVAEAVEGEGEGSGGSEAQPAGAEAGEAGGGGGMPAQPGQHIGWALADVLKDAIRPALDKYISHYHAAGKAMPITDGAVHVVAVYAADNFSVRQFSQALLGHEQFCLHILAPGAKNNSWRSSQLIALLRSSESYACLAAALRWLAPQLVDRDVEHRGVRFRVRMKPTGDMSYLLKVIGHGGCNCGPRCFRCLAPLGKSVGRGVNDPLVAGAPRTWQHVQEAGALAHKAAAECMVPKGPKKKLDWDAGLLKRFLQRHAEANPEFTLGADVAGRPLALNLKNFAAWRAGMIRPPLLEAHDLLDLLHIEALHFNIGVVQSAFGTTELCAKQVGAQLLGKGGVLRTLGLDRPVTGWDGTASRELVDRREEWMSALQAHPACNQLRAAWDQIAVMLEVAWVSGDNFQMDVHPERFGTAAEKYGAVMMATFGAGSLAASAATAAGGAGAAVGEGDERPAGALVPPTHRFGVYEHLAICHGRELLQKHGSMTDQCSLWLEASNKFLRRLLQQHTSHGGGHGAAEGGANPNTSPLLQAFQRMLLLTNDELTAHYLPELAVRANNCRSCGQPRKGHKCPVGEAAVEASERAAELGAAAVAAATLNTAAQSAAGPAAAAAAAGATAAAARAAAQQQPQTELADAAADYFEDTVEAALERAHHLPQSGTARRRRASAGVGAAAMAVLDHRPTSCPF
jgi:hypothetical protein